MIEQYFRPTQLGEPGSNGHSNHEGISCPSCGRSDATLKASSVARSGRGRLLLEDGSSAAYESELCSLLSSPARPEPLPASVVVMALVIGWVLLGLELAILSGVRHQDQVSIPSSALDTATFVGVFWFGLLIPGGALVRNLLRYREVEKRLPAWRQAAERWQAFHYCSRDDLVFVPGEGYGVAPEHIGVLYRETFRRQEPEPEEALS